MPFRERDALAFSGPDRRLIPEGRSHDQRASPEHLIRKEGELEPEATIRKFRIVRREGDREVSRLIEHYSLDAILAVGYRVRSPRGTQFHRWATERLREYLGKGFTMDDERLKNPPVAGSGVPDYFDDLESAPIRSGSKGLDGRAGGLIGTRMHQVSGRAIIVPIRLVAREGGRRGRCPGARESCRAFERRIPWPPWIPNATSSSVCWPCRSA